jgi:hypothetical protein
MSAPARCPVTGVIGRPVDTITLKALLRPPGLATLDPLAQHYYCPDPGCDTVYFGAGRTFVRTDVDVPVLAKEPAGDVPVCYCFGWTRDRLRAAGSVAAQEIRGHIAAGRCGCEVNNPQGACCLGDVERVIRGL